MATLKKPKTAKATKAKRGTAASTPAQKKKSGPRASKFATGQQPESNFISVDLLDFDTANPRFPPEVAGGPEEQLLERFVRDERLLEIIESIGRQGYFPGEPLLVVKNGQRYMVMEGNRRLAALKLLNGLAEPPSGRISIETAIEEAAVIPEKVPCLVFRERDQIVKYLGYRHITGIKAWSALQKARYIKRLREENYPKLSFQDSLVALAKETGSRADYIGQNLAALALYEKAEKENFFGLPVSPDDVDFSILSTSLSYTSIAEFLGLEHRRDVTQATVKLKSLKLMFEWTFVRGSNNKSIVRDSRNLKKLAAIVTSQEAIKELSSSGRIDEAFELSKGPALALAEALNAVEKRLSAVWALIPKVRSTQVTTGHLETSRRVSKLGRQVSEALKLKEDGEDDED